MAVHVQLASVLADKVVKVTYPWPALCASASRVGSRGASVPCHVPKESELLNGLSVADLVSLPGQHICMVGLRGWVPAVR